MAAPAPAYCTPQNPRHQQPKSWSCILACLILGREREFVPGLLEIIASVYPIEKSSKEISILKGGSSEVKVTVMCRRRESPAGLWFSTGRKLPEATGRDTFCSSDPGRQSWIKSHSQPSDRTGLAPRHRDSPGRGKLPVSLPCPLSLRFGAEKAAANKSYSYPSPNL
jgi:hypothetical protein